MAFALPTLPAGGLSGSTPEQQQIWWQQVVEAIAAQETSQDSLITGLADAVADIQATQRRDSISASYTVPTLVATAADAGSDVTITIANHTRYYGDETSKAVTGGTITGLPYSTLTAVYYDDPNRLGGSVSYQSTTDLKSAQNNYVAGRHYVATMTTPAAAAPPTTGGTPPPGSGYTGSGTGGTAIP